MSPPRTQEFKIGGALDGTYFRPLGSALGGGGTQKKDSPLSLILKSPPPSPFALFVGGTTERGGGHFLTAPLPPFLPAW